MKQSSANISYFHQDSLGGTSVVSDANGTLVSSIAYMPFGLTRSGSVPTDKMFTGQRLDGTGLYYYGARYYDPTIGRFISPDTFMLSPSNPQGLNRYSYVFNNPLRYNDPTGNWPPFLDKLINQGVGAIKEGLQVTVSKSAEYHSKITDVSYEAILTVNRVVGEAGEKFQQTMDNLPNLASDAVGIESITPMNTSLVKDVPLIDIRAGSLLDEALFFTDGAVTIYPIGTFTKTTLSPEYQEHEGFHWNEQEDSGPFLPFWYSSYISEYVVDLPLYGFNTDLTHDAVSYEKEANDYAGTGTDPGSPWDYWDWWPW